MNYTEIHLLNNKKYINLQMVNSDHVFYILYGGFFWKLPMLKQSSWDPTCWGIFLFYLMVSNPFPLPSIFTVVMSYSDLFDLRKSPCENRIVCLNYLSFIYVWQLYEE